MAYIHWRTVAGAGSWSARLTDASLDQFVAGTDENNPPENQVRMPVRASASFLEGLTPMELQEAGPLHGDYPGRAAVNWGQSSSDGTTPRNRDSRNLAR